jgi:hypothetical protein
MIDWAIKKFWRCVLGMPGSLHEHAQIGSDFSEQQNCGIENCEWHDGAGSQLGNGNSLKAMPIVRADTGMRNTRSQSVGRFVAGVWFLFGDELCGIAATCPSLP